MASVSPPIAHYFLWISHGINVSGSNAYHVTDLPFKQIVMFSKTFKPISVNKLERLYKHNTCDLFTGNCPILPFTDKTGKKKVFLPTLIFNSLQNDPPDIKKYTGLYYLPMVNCSSYLGPENVYQFQQKEYMQNLIYKIANEIPLNPKEAADAKIYASEFASNPQAISNKLNPTEPILYGPSQTIQYNNEETFLSRKIFDSTQVIGAFGDGGPIAYAQIFDLVKKFSRRVNGYTTPLIPTNIDINDIILGVFSCQDQPQETKTAYQIERSLVTSLLPTTRQQILIADQIQPTITKIYDTTHPPPANSYFSLTVIPLPQGAPLLDNWQPILKLKKQACALNVLSVFRLMEKKYAIEQSTCLTNLGTSIFTIIRYIDSYLKQQQLYPNYSSDYNIYENNVDGYMIYRLPKNEGIQQIYNFMINFNIPNQTKFIPYAIIFKMYKSISTGAGKVDHVGHTVAFYKFYNTTTTQIEIYFVDPQQDNLIQVLPGTSSQKGQYVKISPGENAFEKITYFYTSRGIPFNDMVVNGKNYDAAWNYIDIILSVKSNFDRESSSITTIMSDPQHQIIPNIDETIRIEYGGSKPKQKTKGKSNKSNKRNKNVSKTKNIKKRKTKKYSRKIGKVYKKSKYIKNKKQYGGDVPGTLDPYQQLIQKIDKKYNTPSVIDLENEMVVDMDIEEAEKLQPMEIE